MTRPPDATEVDPEGHRIVFENDHVRILEVRNNAGTHLPMHSHQARVVVAISPYRIRSVAPDGEVTIIDRRPGEANWVDDEDHSAEMLIGPTHVIEVEIKSARS